MSELTYPRHVHQRGGVYRICQDADTYQQALGEGWVDHPLLEWGRVDTYHEWDGSPLLFETGDPEMVVPDEAPKRRGWPKGKPRTPKE